jgi:hypothetical protein
MINCGDADLVGLSADSLRARMLTKLNQALSINETSQIYKDCSIGGCPSAAGIFLGGSTKFADRIPAAYSHLQFAPATLTEIILENLYDPKALARNEINSAIMSRIFNGDATKEQVETASNRARWIYVYGNCMARKPSPYKRFNMDCPSDDALFISWDALPNLARLNFINQTGLNEDAWNFLRAWASGDLVSGKDYVNNTTAQEEIDSVAWAAWNTVPQAKVWFRNLAIDNLAGGRMEALAVAYLQIRENQILNDSTHGLKYNNQTLYPLANRKGAIDEQKIDLEMAMRIARRHNGGLWWVGVDKLKSKDPNNYVKKIGGIFGFETYGNFPSLRCVGKSEYSKNGITMLPLNLG